MSTFEKKEVLLQTIGELFHKMDKGDLSKNEMQDLVENARQLYDRAVIMQYKALEAKVLNSIVEKTTPVEVQEEAITEPEPLIEEKKEETVEEQPRIDFSIFDQVEEEKPEEIEVQPEEKEASIAQEPEIEHTGENIPAAQEENTASSFYEKFSKPEDNSLSSRLSHSKIESLSTAFGFNEKLQVINEMFDGNSEEFKSGINSLDTAASSDSARQLLSELAVKHSWDLEDQLVESFVNKVERRHV